MTVCSALGPCTRCRAIELCVCCALTVTCVALAVCVAATRVYTITGAVVVVIYALRLWRPLPGWFCVFTFLSHAWLGGRRGHHMRAARDEDTEWMLDSELTLGYHASSSSTYVGNMDSALRSPVEVRPFGQMTEALFTERLSRHSQAWGASADVMHTQSTLAVLRRRHADDLRAPPSFSSDPDRAVISSHYSRGASPHAQPGFWPSSLQHASEPVVHGPHACVRVLRPLASSHDVDIRAERVRGHVTRRSSLPRQRPWAILDLRRSMSISPVAPPQPSPAAVELMSDEGGPTPVGRSPLPSTYADLTDSDSSDNSFMFCRVNKAMSDDVLVESPFATCTTGVFCGESPRIWPAIP